MFICMQKWTPFLTSFLRYCKVIASVSFWELWEYLAIPIKIIVSFCIKLSYLSACKKSASSLTSFKILQRSSKRIILGNLDMPGHAHLKWYYQFEVYLQAKNQIHPSRFSWDITNLLFWVPGACQATHTQSYTISSCRKLSCLSAGKKSASFPLLFWRYYEDMQTYFGYFGHAWLHTPTMIVSTCKRLWCLSAC